MPLKLYIVDDEPSLRTAYARLAHSPKMEPRASASFEELIEAELSDDNAVATCDVRMAGKKRP